MDNIIIVTCQDCGDRCREADAELVYDEGERRDVWVCHDCLADRRKKFEEECAQKDWAIPHG